MSLIKKIAVFGLICIVGTNMIGCGKQAAETAATNSTAEQTKDQTKDETKSDDNAQKEDVAIAKIGDTEILRSELDVQLNYQKAYLLMSYGEDFLTTDNGKEYMKQLKEYLVGNIINMKIAELKAEELGQLPKEEDINKAFEQQKANYGSEEEFKKELEASQMTEEDLKKEIKTALTAQNMNTYLGKDAKVTDDEVKQYYKDHVADYSNQAGATISHILVKTEEEAKKVKTEYDGGTSFADLAGKYGTDGTKDNGGSLGFIPYNTQNYDQDFMAAAKKLGEGKVSEPVKTQFGWHLIKAEGIQKEDVVKPFEDVKEEASAACLKEKQNKLITDQLEKWKEELKVETYDDVIATIE
ncbi:peptidyl-prolyl cis-trans isomerase [Cellulosilyticum ruminicola]|uniref:peptidyl-prolyl cis-trans isomerase n=1 Tax=Cellulosilyticum ruminicola TaxID=425254 RepID=UPI0006D2911D|nr:peptidyl-prolyl cis-trans isomerase [Cellulosilyticum ruminicola]